MSNENDLKAELERLKQENEKLKSEKKRPMGISFRVSEKGAVSVYGMGRFPVTLYKEQWNKLFDHMDQLKEFIAENEDRLKTKE